MSYVALAVLAMAAYGTTATLLKVGLRTVPPETAAVVTNLILVGAALGLAVYRGQTIVGQLSWGLHSGLVVLSGFTLSVAILSYYIALSRGPASVVMPIFGMSMAFVAVAGMVILGEEIKATKVAGILLAAGAVLLLTR
ncbi:MAG: transporter family protein [Chloroflexi bacterium]|jgi:transporter family protein|nr:MAG: transporter family protein [Chloroflexota bacterium]